jgi:hypothetical protein
MSKRKLLFRIGYAYHKAAFDPVIESLLQDDKYDCWFSLDMETKRHFGLFDRPYQVPIITQWQHWGYRFTQEKHGFDIVITGDILRDASAYGPVLLCLLNHGTGIKNILYRALAKVPQDTYQIFVEGPHRVRALLQAAPRRKNAVHLIGLPKLDFYFQGRFNDPTRLLQRWGLDPQKQTILYAPTYKPTSLYHLKEDIFQQTTDWNLIIKLHPYSWMGKYARHAQHRIYERRVTHYPHAVLLPFAEYNIVPYLAVADVVLSEASSALFDFLALGKFGIIYDLPCEHLRHSDGQPLLEIDNRDFLRGAFVHINSGKQIRAAIERCLQPTSHMIAAANAYRTDLFYQLDGQATARFVRKMEALYDKGGHENTPLT